MERLKLSLAKKSERPNVPPKLSLNSKQFKFVLLSLIEGCPILAISVVLKSEN